MKQAIGYNETTGVMGGARPFNTYDLGLGGFEQIHSPYAGSTSQTKVLCKDGTFGYDISSSNAKYDNSKNCMNNGGRAENQTVQPLSVTDPELFKKNMELSAKQDENMKQIKYGVIALVLVVSYFAYKKFKK